MADSIVPRSGMFDPDAKRLSTNGRKKAIQRAKKEQGYEKDAPRCANCQRFLPGLNATSYGRIYHAPFCQLGEFAVDPNAYCFKWVGKDGSTLE